MNRKYLIQTFAVILAITASCSTSIAQDIFALRVTGVGKLQDSRTVNEVDVNTITTVAINNNVLISLASGNEPSTKPPANLVLGIILDAEPPQIVIFDKNNPTATPVVIAEVDSTDTVNKGKIVCTGSGEDKVCDAVDTAFEGLLNISFQPVGGEANSISGGQVAAYGKGTQVDGAVNKVTASGSGTLDGTTDESEIFHVLIQKITFTSGKKIGTLPL